MSSYRKYTRISEALIAIWKQCKMITNVSADADGFDEHMPGYSGSAGTMLCLTVHCIVYVVNRMQGNCFLEFSKDGRKEGWK